MIELAKKNNPTARFAVMDSRNIAELEDKYDGIVCGFCIPYLSKADSDRLIANCSGLLKQGGLLYISFVEGDYHKSGFQTGSSGDRTYFYYHNLEVLTQQLQESYFEDIRVLKVEYKRTEGTGDTHTIVTAKRKAI
jgi:SAM-dependent methyltransferase